MYIINWKAFIQICSILSYSAASNAFPGSTSQRRLLAGATVSIYWPSTTRVLDPAWDPYGPSNLERQLKQKSLGVVRVNGQHLGAATAAFVIPPASGDNIYADVENVDALAEWVSSGGLVIVHDSMKNTRATQDLIARVMGYAGNWQYCEATTAAERSDHGDARVSSYAQGFLSAGWPQQLETARSVQAHSWCKHADPAAVSYPLYTIGGDPMKAVAQAFGKVGSPGAVVWLGYSWRDGPQDGWGSLMAQIIRGFAKGQYQAPADASVMNHYPLHLDALLDAAAALADETEAVVRRFLTVSQGPSYGGPGYSSYSAPSYPPPSIAPPPRRPPTAPPPKAPSTAPPPKAPSTASPPKAPSIAPPPQPELPRYVPFQDIVAPGVQGTTRPVVWYQDADFETQLNLQPKNSKLWLINDYERGSCNLSTPCKPCDRAWYPNKTGMENGFPSDAVVFFFDQPVMLKKILLLELSNPGVLEVFLLKWPAVPVPELGLNTTKLYDSVNQQLDVFKVFEREELACGRGLSVSIPNTRSGYKWKVPKGFNQTRLPAFLQRRAVGGVGIRVSLPESKRARPTQVADVRFFGRVLYPRDYSSFEYDQDDAVAY